MFPSRSLPEDKELALLPQLMNSTPRTVILTPSDRRARTMTELVQKALPAARIFTADVIEASKTPFVATDKAVAVLAGRYDGIDFPEADCRLLLVDGMPRAVNLQERFLISRMGASALLNDRIMTRIVQAFGRCTRSATDYSAVVVIGDEVMNLLMRTEKRALLHPELQAELRFGLEQSRGAKPSDYEETLKHFLAQDQEWRDAEAEIPQLRADLKQEPMVGADELSHGVAHEIRYQNAMWEADYIGAMEHARAVLTELKSRELKGYRCLWSYLAGSAATLATRIQGRNFETISREFFYGAWKESSGLTWLRRLAQAAEAAPTTGEKMPRDGALLERFEVFLDDIGSQTDNKLVRFEKHLRVGLAQTAKGPFEEAHVMLGRLLGYDAGNKETPGAPDPWWIVDERLCIIFEDHSDAKPGGAVDVTKARQVASHPKWAKANLRLAEDAEIIAVLVSPATQADTDALPHLDGVSFWSLVSFREWAERAISAVRDARASYPGVAGDMIWRDEARRAFERGKVDLDSLLKLLKQSNAREVLKPQSNS